MIASIAMYDWPERHGHHDRLWARIRDALRAGGLAAPEALTRDRSLWDIWLDPDLLLGQTCGYPFRTRLRGKVDLVATIDYGLPDTPAGYYHSTVVVRADAPGGLGDFLNGILAFNGQDSQSGWASIQNMIEPKGHRFTRFLHTGAHLDSARAVAEGRADIAAIDSVSFRLLRDLKPDIARCLRTVMVTDPTPGLPFVTARGRDTAPLSRAIEEGIRALDPADRADLGIHGLVFVPAESYLAVPIPRPPSQDVPTN